MADMTDLIRRLSLALLLFLLIVGVAGHLFLSVNNNTAREANCPIHGGMVQPEKAQPLTHMSAITIGEILDGTCALSLGAKIPHPPPTN